MRLPDPIRRYARWLHTGWPAGTVEQLPEIRDDGSTNVPGIYVVGDLTGIPLLKFSSDSGARVVRTILADASLSRQREGKGEGVRDLAIVGAGVSGMAAALAASKEGLDYEVFEAKRRFQTLADFPARKPIYTYPTDMTPAGDLQFTAGVKEPLLDEMQRQTESVAVTEAHVESISRKGGLLELHMAGREPVRALRVIVAIGRSGNYRKLDVPGEELEKVHNRLHDPEDFRSGRVLVIGGGDSALETSIALARCGAEVTLSYRKKEFSRPKPENVDQLHELDGRRPGAIDVRMESAVREIRPDEVLLRDGAGDEASIANDTVFSMIGREAPLDFFRRSGIRIAGEWTAGRITAMAAFLLFCLWLYHWKAPYAVPFGLKLAGWLDPNPQAWMAWLEGLGGRFGATLADPTRLLGTIRLSASSPGFYYTLAYSTVVVVFGIRRIRRRKTPYVKRQTLTLSAIQLLPLFLLPEILLPWLGHNGAFDDGILRSVADSLFPLTEWNVHGREYWRAFGLILAWPLFVWNWFTGQPLWGWLVIGFLQTFVLIPGMIYVWGKGAYCGWICSCGALAETLGDQHRQKMPHGPVWNRLNMIGQVILAAVSVLMLLRVLGWVLGAGSWAARWFENLHTGIPLLNYNWLVDLMLAGVLGYGLYFWFSGRMWCRFACPLAALMHIYARFSSFRILADKKKCISCNVCTSVCHQGIDVMNFANKGLPMADPECVRCSACVGACPTGVLTFGRVDGEGHPSGSDGLTASLVQMHERGRQRQ